ncbi:MAG: hypothetical protein M1813_007481 [Trichoglossum hirsutum]|nr:MAG: hypothetical protein M1813_007481 [Trichoglossum hirsutum]
MPGPTMPLKQLLLGRVLTNGLASTAEAVKEYMGTGNPIVARTFVMHNPARNRSLDHTLELAYRDLFMFDGSARNMCIINAARGKVKSDWRGEVVAMKRRGLDEVPSFYGDMTMVDYRDVVDSLTGYRDMATDPHQDRVEKVKGVKISCLGDEVAFQAKKYTAVDVPTDHPMCVDPTEDSWGVAPMRWQDRVGSVLVVRQEGKDITPQHVEALCRFCQYKLSPLFAESGGYGWVQRSRGDVLAFMSRAAFEEFFWQLRAEKLEGAKQYVVDEFVTLHEKERGTMVLKL